MQEIVRPYTVFTIQQISKQNQFEGLFQNQGHNLPFPDFHVSHTTSFSGTLDKYVANNFIIKDSLSDVYNSIFPLPLS